MKSLLLVGFGGFMGSALRYGISVWTRDIGAEKWPLGTLTVNLLGSLLIGLLAGYLSKNLSPNVQLLAVTGFCGGFTTFSAFSLELLKLQQSGSISVTILYICASLIGGIGLCMLGYWSALKWLV